MMKEKNQLTTEETEAVEYEDVKHLSISGFIGIGFAFGVAAGFSAGNLLFGDFLLGMGICVAAGLLGGLVIGLINRKISKSNRNK